MINEFVKYAHQVCGENYNINAEAARSLLETIIWTICTMGGGYYLKGAINKQGIWLYMDLEKYRNIKEENKEGKKATLHLQKIRSRCIIVLTCHLIFALFCTFSDPSLLEMKSKRR